MPWCSCHPPIHTHPQIAKVYLRLYGLHVSSRALRKRSGGRIVPAAVPGAPLEPVSPGSPLLPGLPPLVPVVFAPLPVVGTSPPLPSGAPVASAESVAPPPAPLLVPGTASVTATPSSGHPASTTSPNSDRVTRIRRCYRPGSHLHKCNRPTPNPLSCPEQDPAP